MAAWVLEHDSIGVSSVTTGRVHGALTIWSMVTPEKYGRRGVDDLGGMADLRQ